MLSAILLVLCLSFQVISGSPNHEDELLRSLCAGKQVDLSRASQIQSLAERVTSLGQQADDIIVCPERVRQALVELNQVLNVDNGNVCSPNKVKEIRAYYVRYIEQPAGEQAALSKSLIQFFLGYGLTVSNICKKNMITSLMEEAKHLLSEKDFALINVWTGEQSIMSKVMNEPSDYDDLVLPNDIASVIGANDDHDGMDVNKSQGGQMKHHDKIFIKTTTGLVIEKLQALCERRFKPIYEQLILPLVSLSNIGFNYQGEELERELKEMSTNKEVHQWYRIVYLCETISNVVIIEDAANDDEKKAGEASDGRLVRVLSKEQAEKLITEGGGRRGKGETTLGVGPKIHYDLDFDIKLGDLIVDPQDVNLQRLIQKFDSHKSEMDRMRSKVLRKLLSFMKDFFKSGKVNLVGSLNPMNGADGSGNLNDDMVKTIDEFVAQTSPGAGQDRPVAGMGSQPRGGLSRFTQNVSQFFRRIKFNRENLFVALVMGFITIAFLVPLIFG